MLSVRPEQVTNSTIPMPIFQAKIPRSCCVCLSKLMTTIACGLGSRSPHPNHLPRTSHSQQPVITDPQIILRWWQDLASRNFRSTDHRLLSMLFDVEESRYTTLGFRGKDAATVINAIDKVSTPGSSIPIPVADNTRLRLP